MEQCDVVFHRFGGDLAVIIFILAVNCNDQVNMISIWQTATNQTVIFSTDKYPNLSGGINSIAVNSVYVHTSHEYAVFCSYTHGQNAANLYLAINRNHVVIAL